MAPRIVLITQARMESTRLPGKVLMDLAGQPLLSRVVQRLARAESVDCVVVAMPVTSANDVLEDACRVMGFDTYRGDLDDVLGRYCGAARAYDADVVVRVTSDCPFCDPKLVDEVIAALLADGSLDYASNNLRRTYPLGFDAEAVRAEALYQAEKDATQPHEREHVTPYLYQHPDLFRLANIEAPPELHRPDYRLTVDEPDDLALARAVFERLGAGFSAREVVELLDGDESLRAINAHVANKNVERPASW